MSAIYNTRLQTAKLKFPAAQNLPSAAVPRVTEYSGHPENV
jgi:hypothetical protein